MVSARNTGPTPFADVNALLRLLLTKVQAILGSQLVGLYLYGSLSLGDFDPASSDVDFLAVTVDELPEELLERLREMHEDIASSGLRYARRLEGSYIPLKALRRYDPNNARHPTIGVDWAFHVEDHGANWVIERSIVRKHGIIISGPSPQTLIDPVSVQELQAAVCAQLTNFWQTQPEEPAWLRPRDYQAFAVFTLCRALYALREGVISSKPQAATWAQSAYPRWRPIIERALLWRSQHEEDDLTETMAFLREALTEALRLCEQDA